MEKQDYGIVETGAEHIHNPFRVDGKPNLFSAIFNAGELIDRNTGTAKCKCCGQLIGYPKSVLTYSEVMAWLYAPIITICSLCAIPLVGPIYNDVPWGKLIAFAAVILTLSLIIWHMIPLIILAYRPWCIIPIQARSMEKTMKLRRDDIREQKKTNSTYACISYILSFLLFSIVTYYRGYLARNLNSAELHKKLNSSPLIIKIYLCVYGEGVRASTVWWRIGEGNYITLK